MEKKSKLVSQSNKKYRTPKQQEGKNRIREAISDTMLQQKQIKSLEAKAKNSRAIKGFFAGKYSDSNLYYYMKGLEVLRMLANGGLEAYEFYLNASKGKNKKTIAKEVGLTVGRTIMNTVIDVINNKLNERYESAKSIYRFEQTCKFIDEGRNIITEERSFDGITTQQTMKNTDIHHYLQRLIESMDEREESTLNMFTAIGEESIKFLGAITQLAKESKKDAIILGALAALRTAYQIMDTSNSDKEDELFKQRRQYRDEKRQKERAFLEATPTNRQDIETAKKNVIDATKKEIEQNARIGAYRNKRYYRNDCTFLAMMGVVVFSELKKHKGKLNENAIAQIILNIGNKRRFLNLCADSVRRISYKQAADKDYKNNLEKVLEMAQQIEKKSNELSTPKVRVKSISFKNFRGEFYKTKIKDKIVPECVINIPNMEVKTGETILITGNSGSGKSTLLNFLRDGDLDNKGQIIVNGTEIVDKLGIDIVSICEAKMNLSSYNALQDITGKERLKDLTVSEKAKLEEIFRDLGLIQQSEGRKEDFAAKCEYKTYQQFSTGQQKRLELAKVLFAINDDSQVILLDETVSNVQKELGESAFNLIRKYTKKGQPKIVMMVSHDIETASRYADKRYHIDENQTMVEVPIRQQKAQDFRKGISDMSSYSSSVPGNGAIPERKKDSKEVGSLEQI